MAKEFKQIAGFSKYETDGETVKNISTGNTMNCKTGTDKFQLTNDHGIRKLITLEDINEIQGVKPVKEEKVVKLPAKEKEVVAKDGVNDGEKPAKVDVVALYKQGKSVKQISDETGVKYNTAHVAIKSHLIREMYAETQEASEIAMRLQMKVKSVKGYIKHLRLDK